MWALLTHSYASQLSLNPPTWGFSGARRYSGGYSTNVGVLCDVVHHVYDPMRLVVPNVRRYKGLLIFSLN